MVNKIIVGIAQALDAMFGYTIYTDEVKQDLITPCFFVLSGAVDQNQIIGSRYKNDNGFIIQCIPQKGDGNTFLYDIENKMFDGLEYITVEGDPLRGIHMQGTVVDEVLTFQVNYNLHVLKPVTPVDSMEALSMKGSVK